jgi:hypothetical protein
MFLLSEQKEILIFRKIYLEYHHERDDPGSYVGGEIESGEIESGEIGTREIESREIESYEVESDEVESDEVESGEIESDEVELVRLNLVRLNLMRLDLVRLELISYSSSRSSTDAIRNLAAKRASCERLTRPASLATPADFSEPWIPAPGATPAAARTLPFGFRLSRRNAIFDLGS